MSTNLLKWKNMPVLLSSTNDDSKDDIFYTFELRIDKETGIIQQVNTPPQDILYKNSRNSGTGSVWKKHYDSIFVLGQKSNNNMFIKISDIELSNIKSSINEYICTLQNKIKKAIETINNIDDIYIFGCHAMTSLFLYLSNISTTKFKGVLDNDPLKNKLRLYGTDLTCFSPNDVQPTNVLLNDGVYHNEIKHKLVEQGFKVIEWI